MQSPTHKVYDLFRTLNRIPRPSHHEAKVADYLCQYAESLGLDYLRDAENCVVIRKAATPGHEDAEPVVLLNHMDMVAVSDGTRPFDPLNDAIEAYSEDGWMKARGTSLGADNGVGLSMALAVLADDSIVHGPLEVLTTTNEEDGMSGAANMSTDFVRGRKVINLDSEDYDTITVGAAGAYIQVASLPITRKKMPENHRAYKIELKGGLGGHSGVDINKGRINANHALCTILREIKERGCGSLLIADINGGVANASIPGDCTATVAVDERETALLLSSVIDRNAQRIKASYPKEPHIELTIEETDYTGDVIDAGEIAEMVSALPCGVIRMHDTLPDTPMTSTNIGMIRTEEEKVTVSCHTRSFDDNEMVDLATECTRIFEQRNAKVEVLMNTPGWQENPQSEYLKLVDETFRDILHFSPRKVAMHFVLEAGYYVQKFPGIEIACIGPRIIEPHSTKERVELATVDNIYQVLTALLKRLA